MDAITADPALCSWDPETLLCGLGGNATSCLTQDRVGGLKKFYLLASGPVETWCSRFSPQVESVLYQQVPVNAGVKSPLSAVRRPRLIG